MKNNMMAQSDKKIIRPRLCTLFNSSVLKLIQFMKGINLIAAILLLAGCRSSVKNNYNTWAEYLGGPDRNHYSTLSQIDTSNVHQLKIAWSYDAPDSGQMEMSPIMVNGAVYGVTA